MESMVARLRHNVLSLISVSLCFFSGCASTSKNLGAPYNLQREEGSGSKDYPIPPIMNLNPISQLINPLGFQHLNVQQTNNPPETYRYLGILRNLNHNNGAPGATFPNFSYNPIKKFLPFFYPQKNNYGTIPIFLTWNFSYFDQLVNPHGFKYQNFLANKYSWEGFQYACIIKNLYRPEIIQAGFPLIYNTPVEQFIQYFQNKENFLKSALGRAKKYRPLMASIFRENELPEDLVYLSLIESGFNPHAYSHSGACGPWQLMKATARRYGLRVDQWVDERRDPEKSTEAAVRYLKDLYTMFGDWYLALTAYNAGEGRVAKAIQRYNSTDLWYLREKTYLKQESCDFVPKLLAAITIGKQPEDFGFSDIQLPDPVPPLTKIHIPYSLDLKVVASMAEISLSELKRHNPELRSWCTPPGKQGYWIKIPELKKEIFSKNYSKNKGKLKKVTKFQKHQVKAGETLGAIARKYHTTVNKIIKLNGIKNPHCLHLGQILEIPTS